MLSDDKKQILNQFASTLSVDELAWASGYLAGLAAGGTVVIGGSDQKKISGNLTLFYVTETGNSKFLASEISKRLKALGANVKIKASDQYRLSDLEKETNIALFVSTHGDGEMPASGKKFLDYLKEDERDLSKLHYGVVALGDTSYPLFCQSGKDLDKIFEEKKAKRSFERLDLDLDFEQRIDEVEASILKLLKVNAPTHTTTKISQFSAKKEFEGEVITNVNLNDVGSDKETRHLEISIPEDVAYEPGDAIAVVLGEKELGTKEKVAPRLYSIASSRNEHGSEVHLTVSVVRYVDEQGKQRGGLTSSYLSALKPGDKLQLYVSKNRPFKLPPDDKNVIMVGPGTGIAPFRSFLAERNFRGASGKNWLFFGEQHFRTDFLYQTEWQAHLDSGLLSRMDVAFSRDPDPKTGALRAAGQKIYVQNRMEEKSAELFNWLENGAYFYVCGDKKNMARDVENALLSIVAKHGNKSAEAAGEYLAKLSEEGRYLKDVY